MWGKLPLQAIIFAATAAAMMGVISMARGLVDADFYWHVTAGGLIADQGVLERDPFSYTWGGQPWVMHEWAGQLLIYRLTSSIGPALTAFLFGIVATVGPLAVALAIRPHMPFAPLAFVWALVLYLITPYATIRPQILSWMFLGILLAGLIVTRPRHRWLPWLALPLVLVWANIHGLYVIGLGVLVTYAAMTWIGWTPMAPDRRRLTLVVVTALATSLITPAGLEGLVYPLRYLEAGDWGLLHIAEWQSPDFHDAGQLGFLLFICLLLANPMRAEGRWLTVMAACGIAGGLLAVRNVPLAALLGMPALAYGLAARYRAWRPTDMPVSARVRLARGGMEAVLGVVLVAATAAVVPRLPQVAGELAIPRYFPVEAVEVLAHQHPNARVFAEYQWGGYVINRLYSSGARVFVDGRNDMYPQTILEDFVTIRNTEVGWQHALERWGADAILLPPAAPLARGPAQDAGWCVVHAEEVSVLMLRCESVAAMVAWP